MSARIYKVEKSKTLCNDEKKTGRLNIYQLSNLLVYSYIKRRSVPARSTYKMLKALIRLFQQFFHISFNRSPPPGT